MCTKEFQGDFYRISQSILHVLRHCSPPKHDARSSSPSPLRVCALTDRTRCVKDTLLHSSYAQWHSKDVHDNKRRVSRVIYGTVVIGKHNSIATKPTIIGKQQWTVTVQNKQCSNSTSTTWFSKKTPSSSASHHSQYRRGRKHHTRCASSFWSS